MPTALKVEFFTPTGIFKTPFSVKGIEIYPLPPYSTIIGLLYTAIDRKWKGETFKISIQGDYDELFRDYIRFRKYNKKDKVLETLPLELPILHNFRLTVHLVGDDKILKEFEQGIKRPKKYLFMSAGELPVKIVKVRRVYIKEESLEDYPINKNAYIPCHLKERVYFSPNVFYRIPSFYKTTNHDIREHIWEDVYYVSKGSYITGDNILIDEEGDPLWL